MSIETLSATTELQAHEAAVKETEEARADLQTAAAHRATLATECSRATGEAESLAAIAIEAAGNAKSFPPAVSKAVEAEAHAKFLTLAVSRADRVAVRDARRVLLVAELTEAESLEKLADATRAAHEQQVKAELK